MREPALVRGQRLSLASAGPSSTRSAEQTVRGRPVCCLFRWYRLLGIRTGSRVYRLFCIDADDLVGSKLAAARRRLRDRVDDESSAAKTPGWYLLAYGWSPYGGVCESALALMSETVVLFHRLLS